MLISKLFTGACQLIAIVVAAIGFVVLAMGR